MIDEARAEHPGLADVVLIGESSWDELRDRGARGDRDRLATIGANLAASDAINIQYTSGTTGFPKGATLSHTNILNNGWFVGELIDYTEHDRVCIPVPFYHCFGMAWATSPAPRTGRRWSSRRPGSTLLRPCDRSPPSAAPRCTACRPCSSRCWRTPSSTSST